MVVRPVGLVGQEPSPFAGSTYKSNKKLSHRDLYRQLAVRVRSFLRRRRRTRYLGRRQIRTTHKRVRDARSSDSSGILHKKYPGGDNLDEDRQQNGLVVHKQDGGTRSQVLLDLALKFWELVETRKLVLRAEYIRSKDNVAADLLSRVTIHKREWTLHRRVFTAICKKWGIPEMDLFAAITI